MSKVVKIKYAPGSKAQRRSGREDAAANRFLLRLFERLDLLGHERELLRHDLCVRGEGRLHLRELRRKQDRRILLRESNPKEAATAATAGLEVMPPGRSSPSPKINPEASTIIGVSSLPLHRIQYHANTPPAVRASVNEGVLYMPTATAIPPGTYGTHHAPFDPSGFRILFP